MLSASRGTPSLKGTRYCLLKGPENLTEGQEIKLAESLKYNLRTVRAYLLKEDFQSFWDYVSPAWAGTFLDRWCTRTMRSRLEPMKRVAHMLRRHRPLLPNWFRARGTVSAAAVEGLNNKLKVTTKKAYGFRTFRALEIALYHTDPSLVTSIVKSYVPGVVGIPVISPFAAKLNPVGKGPEPDARLHV